MFWMWSGGTFDPLVSRESESGEKISCVVEHASLKEPLVTDWDPSMPESERNKIAIGASGLILGLILSLAGFIYYRRKARGQKPVYTSFHLTLPVVSLCVPVHTRNQVSGFVQTALNYLLMTE
uniref:Ig-like domain-containing protein n=1 Tax=Seriola lalandi dorsalis TaxID=1841481 RepID=A0A3B4X3S1_SERLL